MIRGMFTFRVRSFPDWIPYVRTAMTRWLSCSGMNDMLRVMSLATLVLSLLVLPSRAQVLDHQKLLDSQNFWDNRDWDWYKANIPFFECPDADIITTYNALPFKRHVTVCNVQVGTYS